MRCTGTPQPRHHPTSHLHNCPHTTHHAPQVLRELLLEGAQHSVELYEGFGANWALAR